MLTERLDCLSDFIIVFVNPFIRRHIIYALEFVIIFTVEKTCHKNLITRRKSLAAVARWEVWFRYHGPKDASSQLPEKVNLSKKEFLVHYAYWGLVRSSSQDSRLPNNAYF